MNKICYVENNVNAFVEMPEGYDAREVTLKDCRQDQWLRVLSRDELHVYDSKTNKRLPGRPGSTLIEHSGVTAEGHVGAYYNASTDEWYYVSPADHNLVTRSVYVAR